MQLAIENVPGADRGKMTVVGMLRYDLLAFTLGFPLL